MKCLTFLAVLYLLHTKSSHHLPSSHCWTVQMLMSALRAPTTAVLSAWTPREGSSAVVAQATNSVKMGCHVKVLDSFLLLKVADLAQIHLLLWLLVTRVCKQEYVVCIPVNVGVVSSCCGLLSQMLMSALRAPTTAVLSAWTPREGSSVAVPMGTNSVMTEYLAKVSLFSSFCTTVLSLTTAANPFITS